MIIWIFKILYGLIDTQPFILRVCCPIIYLTNKVGFLMLFLIVHASVSKEPHYIY